MSAPHYSPLLTDLYQLTMGYGFFQHLMHEKQACFHVVFRTNPFKGNYTISCGLGSVIELIEHWRFEESDIQYLASLKNPEGMPFFTESYLAYLAKLKFTCDVDAIPEGTVVFPNEPILRIEGPLIQCQLLESILLNILNFQTLIATKASRVVAAAQGDFVVEFGMRRAQGPDGAISASRAAYIGGCDATSNTLAGKLYDIPVRGTHAHSWISAFPSEQEAFSAYIDIMPNNSVLLVDTYNTIKGVEHAIEAGKRLREEGSDLIGIRLDSGDLAKLSIKAREMLDAEGFTDTIIFASNTLDEYVIQSLKEQRAEISAWGVGTHLVTSYDQPALDGVYKLSALKNDAGLWEYKLKLSEQDIKISNPGRHQVRRFFIGDQYFTDVVYDLDLGIEEAADVVLLNQEKQPIRLDAYDACVDLLVPVYRKGQLVLKETSIHAMHDLALMSTKDFIKQHQHHAYPIGLESKLNQVKEALMTIYRED